jgi:molecular chaperone GrpE
MSDEQQTTEGAGVPEATGSEVGSQAEQGTLEPSEARIQELEQKLAAAEAEAKSNHARMLRVAADFENHRKRSIREVDDAKRSGAQNALNKLLPVFDNLERATSHIDGTSDAKSMADGLRMVMKQFGEALAKLGIERVESVGKPFDPMLHESIQYDFHPTIAAGLVAQELQAGYRQGDALMRPALVVVSKGPSPDAVEPSAGAAAGESGTADPSATAPGESGSPSN